MSGLFSRILVGVDEAEPSQRAVELAARLAHEHGGSLVLCYALNWMPLVVQVESEGAFDPTELVDGLRRQGQALLAAAAETARRGGVEAELRLVEGEPAGALLDLARDAACSSIVMGTHGRRGLGRAIVGSTTEAVLRGSAIPVLTFRPGEQLAPPSRRCFERILVGIDDSGPSDVALETALALPPEDRTSVTFGSVVDIDSIVGPRFNYTGAIRDELHEHADAVVAHALRAAAARGIDAGGRVFEGRAADQLVAAATEVRADLIIVGSHGRRGFQRFVLGSVAENVVRTAPVPVLVVRGVAKVPATAPAGELVYV